MNMKLGVFVLMVCGGIAFSASAQDSVASVMSAFRLYKNVPDISLNAPTVVEVPLADEFMERADVAVFNVTTNTFEPHFFKQEVLDNKIPVSISANPSVGNVQYMNDGNPRTYLDVPLPDNAQGQLQVVVSADNPFTSSQLTVLLGNNVALPHSVEIRAIVNDQNRIIVAKRTMDRQTIRFPQTMSDKWTVTFAFGQPLHISELQFSQDKTIRSSTQSVRFLAQPASVYRVYFDADRLTTPIVAEAGNLMSAQDVLLLASGPSQENTQYRIADVDADGVPDIRDNCVSIRNADQTDVNNNGRGDVCDDFDKDGLINSKDNCQNNPNKNQQDTDGDGIGDLCDREESRITERYTLVPWIGIGFAAFVLVVLVILTLRPIRKAE